jgi:hypothetical protein
MLADAVRARGSFHRLNHDVAVRHANRSTAELVAVLEAQAGSRRLPVVTTYRNVLRRARPRSGHRSPARPPPTHAGRRRGDGRHPRLDDGLAVLATDADWSVGEGADLRGPISALLLLLTGRTVALHELRSAGASELLVRLGGQP